MAESTYVKVKRDGIITIQDAAAANTYTVAYEDGNLTFSTALTDQVVIRDRGAIVGCRFGDDPILTGSFSVHMRQFASAASENLCDAIYGVNSCSGWTKVNTAFEQFNVDIVMSIAGGLDGTGSEATFNTCICKWDFKEGDPDAISVTFEIFEGITLTGPA